MKAFVVSIVNAAKRRQNLLAERMNAASDAALLLMLSLVYLVIRLLALPFFELGGDIAHKWRFLRYFHETGIWFPAEVDHHQGRWIQNVPELWLMDLFGTADPWYYYILPILTGWGVLILVYLIARLFTDRFRSALVFTMTALFPTFISESGQLLPLMPACLFTLLALYLMLRYLEKPTRLFLPLLAGVSMGLAWGGKVTVIYWCTGIGLFLLFFKVPGSKDLLVFRRFRLGRDTLLFAAGFLIVLSVETILINRLFNVPWGRISMLTGHTGDSPNQVQCGVIEYLLSIIVVPFYAKGKALYIIPRYCIFLLTFPAVFLWLTRKDAPLRKKFLAFAFTVTLFLHCYMVVRVFPFKHPERHLLRYYLIMNSLGFVFFIAGWDEIVRWCGRWKPARFIPALCATLLAFTTILGFFNNSLRNHDNLYWCLRNRRNIAVQRREKLPVLVSTHRAGKSLPLWYAIFGPTEGLPTVSREVEDLPCLYDERGKSYITGWGTPPPTGKPVKVLIIRENQSWIKNAVFRGEQTENVRKRTEIPRNHNR